MTDSDSITEQAARAEAVETGAPAIQLLACTRCGVLLWDIEAHYAHAHPDDALAHRAPATEDEAAEVQWARAFRTNDGLFVDDDEGAFRDAEDVAAFVKPQNPESPYDLIVSRTVGPWREVSP